MEMIAVLKTCKKERRAFGRIKRLPHMNAWADGFSRASPPENPLQFGGIGGKIEDGNIKCGRPPGVGSIQRPCTSAITTQHSSFNCTTGLLYPFLSAFARAEEAFPHLPFPAVIPRFPGPEGSVRRKDLVSLEFLSTPQADRPRAFGAGAVSVCRNGRKLR